MTIGERFGVGAFIAAIALAVSGGWLGAGVLLGPPALSAVLFCPGRSHAILIVIHFASLAVTLACERPTARCIAKLERGLLLQS